MNLRVFGEREVGVGLGGNKEKEDMTLRGRESAREKAAEKDNVKMYDNCHFFRTLFIL